jgi:hypothetical protein
MQNVVVESCYSCYGVMLFYSLVNRMCRFKEQNRGTKTTLSNGYTEAKLIQIAATMPHSSRTAFSWRLVS